MELDLKLFVQARRDIYDDDFDKDNLQKDVASFVKSLTNKKCHNKKCYTIFEYGIANDYEEKYDIIFEDLGIFEEVLEKLKKSKRTKPVKCKNGSEIFYIFCCIEDDRNQFVLLKKWYD